ATYIQKIALFSSCDSVHHTRGFLHSKMGLYVPQVLFAPKIPLIVGLTHLRHVSSVGSLFQGLQAQARLGAPPSGQHPPKARKRLSYVVSVDVIRRQLQFSDVETRSLTRRYRRCFPRSSPRSSYRASKSCKIR